MPGVRRRKRRAALRALPRVAPETLGELVSVREIVSTGAVSTSTVRRAYRLGELQGFIPAGRDPRRAGRSGYRFRKSDVLAWLYGKSGAAIPPE